MPWCDDCSRWFSPNALTTQGECPKCGSDLADHPDQAADGGKVPWHLWLVLAAVVLYLGWRLVQGAGWLAGRF